MGVFEEPNYARRSFIFVEWIAIEEGSASIGVGVVVAGRME